MAAVRDEDSPWLAPGPRARSEYDCRRREKVPAKDTAATASSEQQSSRPCRRRRMADNPSNATNSRFRLVRREHRHDR